VLQRLRDQARIQIASEQRSDGRPAYKVRPLEQQSRGLAMLPAPDAGDIWFDMEGFPDPISGEKLEYLFGACYRDDQSTLQFQPWWAHSPAEEKQAFCAFVAVGGTAPRAPSQPACVSLRQLREDSSWQPGRPSPDPPVLIDQWLRDELLVDLYPIVRNGLLVGAPSYSIKKVERLYGEARQEEVGSAAESVVQYAEWRKCRSANGAR
jgi:predicted RecB family nuclease